MIGAKTGLSLFLSGIQDGRRFSFFALIFPHLVNSVCFKEVNLLKWCYFIKKNLNLLC
jgi:hypothetical protein